MVFDVFLGENERNIVEMFFSMLVECQVIVVGKAIIVVFFVVIIGLFGFVVFGGSLVLGVVDPLVVFVTFVGEVFELAFGIGAVVGVLIFLVVFFVQIVAICCVVGVISLDLWTG